WAGEIRVAGVVAKRVMRQFFSSWRGLVISIVTPFCLLFFLAPSLGAMVDVVDQGGHQVDYITFFLPGIITITLFYGVVFTTGNVVVLDRVTGFGDIVRLSPGKTVTIMAGHVLGSSVVAIIQAGMFLLIGFLFSPEFVVGPQMVYGACALLLGLLFFGILGFVLGSKVSFSNFSLVLTLASIPLVYASTIFVPVEYFSFPLNLFVLLNPVSILADIMRISLLDMTSWGFIVALPGSGLVIDVVILSILTLVLSYHAIVIWSGRSKKSRRSVLFRKSSKGIDAWDEVFQRVAGLIGKEALNDILPLIREGRIDEVLARFDDEKIKAIIGEMKAFMGR
nr:ABC transporter permease [Candidatus Sigynarchaeota archaeon]